MLDPSEIRSKALRQWNNGRVLRAWLGQEEFFPFSIPLGAPTAGSLLNEFPRVGGWKESVESGGKCHTGSGYRIEYREVNHRQMGRQRLPQKAVFDEAADLIAFIGKQREFQRFARLARDIRSRFPSLKSWIEAVPLKVLEQEGSWPRLLAVLDYFIAHPRPALYLRELEIPGVDSKFIEGNKRILSELLDRLLAPASIDDKVTGMARHGFERRFGLRYDQPQIRFRLLDEVCAVPFGGLTDISLPLAQFSRLAPDCERIFITENKINGLSFPPVKGGIVIFGLGYGISSLRDVGWLQNKEIHYWGDIDTHGFAILSQLRSYFPEACSMLMGLAILKEHTPAWVREEKNKRFSGRLDRLTTEEQETYLALCENRLGENLRLEQERIPFQMLTGYLQHL